LRWEYAFWALILWLFVWQPFVARSVGRIRSSTKHRQERLHSALQAARAAMRRDDWQATLTECDHAQALLSRPDIVLWLEYLVHGYSSLRQVKMNATDARGDVHFFRAVALENLGRLDQAVTEYDRCMAANRSGKPSQAPLVYFGQGSSLARLGRWTESEEKLRLCLAKIDESPSPQLSVRALRTLALVCWNTRRPEEALRHTQEALDVARSLGDEFVVGQFLDALGDMALTLNRPEEALRNYESSLDVFRMLDHRGALTTVQRDIAHLYQVQGDWTKSMAWLRVCLREAELGEDLANQAMATYEMGCLHMIHGELSEAFSLLTRSMGLFRRGQDKNGVSRVGSTLMGLGITMHRQATADRMTFGDIVRGSAKKMGEGES
jgi:tetratricopeptide (TPR) repeat protein